MQIAKQLLRFKRSTSQLVDINGMITKEMLDLTDIKQIEIILKDYQITIFKENSMSQEPYYKGPPNHKHIYICYTKSHFNTVTKPQAFLKSRYFCHSCKKGYDHTNQHACEINCKRCHREICLDTDRQLICKDCKSKCNSLACFQFHKKLCSQRKTCNLCLKKIYHNHVCENLKWCANCFKSVELNGHKCYIKKEEVSNYSEYSIIAFDYECYRKDDGDHTPNLTSKCTDQDCPDCIDREFAYENASENFCEWLFEQKHSIALAHNMQGYDGIFIIQFINKFILPSDSEPKIVKNGTKLLSIEWRGVKIIDSMSFLPMALAKFESTFDLKELKKGFFPHNFNRPENYKYIGPIPPKEDYTPQFFSNKKFKEFNEWYKTQLNIVFNFDSEIKAYCWSDVNLLLEGCLEFRKIMMKITKLNPNDTGVDPFKKCLTLASVCLSVYRRNFMPLDSIAILPENQTYEKTSIKCQKWIKYTEHEQEITINNAKNGLEYKVGPYKLDGICHQNKTIYEFHGCLFHGCPKCYKPDTYNVFKKEPMLHTYKKHLNRINYIKLVMPEYKFEEMWEHEYDLLEQFNDEFYQFVNNCDIEDLFNHRDALFGGRTNCLKIYYKCKEGERICFVDFKSLYPFIQKYFAYPFGHPIRIINNFQTLENYFGLIKCKLLPPRNLYLPVLPAIINNKLIFTLCKKCANEKNRNCNHNEDERAIDGVWCSVEVLKAIEMGYTVVKVYSVLHYPEQSKYDEGTKTGGLFSEYVNLFLKIKEEASGYPQHVETEEHKDEFIKNFFEKEGVQLDKENIKKNEGMRSVAKLLLNSFWGRFAMNPNKTQTKFISNEHEWFEMISNDEYIIHDLIFVSESRIQVSYSINSNLFDQTKNVSAILGIFTTAYGRIKLYDELVKLGDRALYFDTDSIIYVDRPGCYNPKIGEFLGDLTNELPEDDYIDVFVSAGAKNYAYKLKNSQKTVCKVKGFTLNNIASEVINFESMKNLILSNREEKLSVTQLKFTRALKGWSISTHVMNKLYSFCSDKRIILDNNDTIPYGYKY